MLFPDDVETPYISENSTSDSRRNTEVPRKSWAAAAPDQSRDATPDCGDRAERLRTGGLACGSSRPKGGFHENSTEIKRASHGCIVAAQQVKRYHFEHVQENQKAVGLEESQFRRSKQGTCRCCAALLFTYSVVTTAELLKSAVLMGNIILMVVNSARILKA